MQAVAALTNISDLQSHREPQQTLADTEGSAPHMISHLANSGFMQPNAGQGRVSARFAIVLVGGLSLTLWSAIALLAARLV
jgi:hypothetical protein